MNGDMILISNEIKLMKINLRYLSTDTFQRKNSHHQFINWTIKMIMGVISKLRKRGRKNIKFKGVIVTNPYISPICGWALSAYIRMGTAYYIKNIEMNFFVLVLCKTENTCLNNASCSSNYSFNYLTVNYKY